MMQAYDTLIGAVIGLARATESNEDLVTESTHRTMLTALRLPPDASEEAILKLIPLIQAEKRKLVPNCFDCAMPCGRTSDLDLRELRKEGEALRTAKLALLTTLHKLAKNTDPLSPSIPLFYQALNFIGYDYATLEQIQNIKDQLYRPT